MTADESAVVAGGFLVQRLPGARRSEADRVEANVRALPTLTQALLVGIDCDEIIDLILEGGGSRNRHSETPVFHCPCTRERALRTLALLGHASSRA